MNAETNPAAQAEGQPTAITAHRRSAALSLGAVVEFALRYATVLVLVALLIATTFLYDGFWGLDNLRNILSQNAPIGLIAIGMTYVIISGGFDLSVGALLAAGSVIFAFRADWPLLPAILFTVLVGALAGSVNGLVITKFKVNSFIATIGTGAIFAGLTFLYTSSSIFVDDPSFQRLGLARALGIPWCGWLLFAFFAVASFVLNRTVYGKWIYAVGGNAEAARLAGIPVNRVRISAFALVGACATLAGAVLASQLSVGEPKLGVTTALDAFAIVVIGGTSVYGGEGALWRTAVGLSILSVMSNLFNSLTLDAATQNISKGAILVFALGIDALARNRRGR